MPRFATHFRVRGRVVLFTAPTLANLAEQWSCYRDTTDAGASEVSGGEVTRDCEPLCRMSYNGRLWADVERFAEHEA